MEDWTEKYRPTTLHDLIGNKKAIKQLKNWAIQWKQGKPKKKAVILDGKAGIGKTSAAYALAHDFHWIPLELNTSDARNEQCIKAVATAGATHQTFNDQGQYVTTSSGGRKLIILDEADNLYERISGAQVGSQLSDKGGKKAIIDTIKITQQPIILIVNDYYNLTKGSGAALKKLALHLRWYPPFPSHIQQLLHSICQKEQIKTNTSVLQTISIQCQGDIRSAVRDLQSICVNKTEISNDDIMVLGNRDRNMIIFDVLKTVFTTQQFDQIKYQIRNLDIDPRTFLFWVSENIPTSYQDHYDMSHAFDMISKGDIFLGRTFNRQHYRFWAYALDLTSLGVSAAKTHRVRPSKYRFPSWLKKRKRQKKTISSNQLPSELLSSYLHCSNKKTLDMIQSYYSGLIQNDPMLFESLLSLVHLKNKQPTSAFGLNHTSEKKEKNQKKEKKSSEKSTNDIRKEKKEDVSEENESKNQSLLFDF